jgi:hypothetical protein
VSQSPTLTPYIISQTVDFIEEIRNKPGLWLNAYVGANGPPIHMHRASGHFALATPSAKMVFQSFFMLITVQPSALAVSSSAWLKVPILLSGSPSAGP